MTPTLTQNVLRRAAQLGQVTEQNRGVTPGAAGAQRLALETYFSNHPRTWGAITATEEWRQLVENSALHEDQFRVFVERFAPDAESEPASF